MPRGRRLTKIDMEFISLVPEGANRRYFLAKAGGRFELAVPIRKVDTAKRQVTGVVYGIGELDAHGDFSTEDDFDWTMHGFMRKGRVAAGIAGDIEHDEAPTEDYFCEVWKIREGDPLFPNDVGAWAVTRQIVVDETWDRVEKGELKAFSFGGSALVQEGVTVTKSDRKKLAKQTADLAKLSVSEDMDQRHVSRLLESICNTLWETYYQAPPDTDDEKAALREVLSEAQSLMKTKEAGSMSAKLKKFFADLASLAKQHGEEEDPTPQAPAEPEAVPVNKATQPTPAPQPPEEEEDPSLEDAMAALQGVVSKALAPVSQRLDDLEKRAPAYVPSDRLEVTKAPGSVKIWKGTFANIPGWRGTESPTVGEYLDALEKGLISPTAASTMAPEVFDAVLAAVADVDAFLKGITITSVRSPNQRIPRLDAAQRRSRTVIPDTYPDITGQVTMTERVLNPAKMITPYDIEEDWYDHNVLGDSAELWLRTQLTRVWALDGVDLGMNGNDELTVQPEPHDNNFLRMNDGWLKIAANDPAVHRFDHNGSTDYLNVVFPGMIRRMPPKYRSLKLRFFCHQEVYDAYVEQLGERPTARGDAYIIDGATPRRLGYEVMPVPKMCEGIEELSQQKILLTPHSNFVMGVWYNLRYHTERKPRLDTIQHTLKGKTDYEFRDADAIVYSENFS